MTITVKKNDNYYIIEQYDNDNFFNLRIKFINKRKECNPKQTIKTKLQQSNILRKTNIIFSKEKRLQN